MNDIENGLIQASEYIAKAIIDSPVGGERDEAGGYVNSLTDAVMGVTAGLMAISRAIERLADVIGESHE